MDLELCRHLEDVREIAPRTPGACEECVKVGDGWVHLRLCMECGQVGCCNDSKNQHAMKHSGATGHPVVKSLEPGEGWLYCYLDEIGYDPA